MGTPARRLSHLNALRDRYRWSRSRDDIVAARMESELGMGEETCEMWWGAGRGDVIGCEAGVGAQDTLEPQTWVVPKRPPDTILVPKAGSISSSLAAIAGTRVPGYIM